MRGLKIVILIYTFVSIGTFNLFSQVHKSYAYEDDTITHCKVTTEIYTSVINMCNNNPLVLVWEDNFEGDNLDLDKWTKIEGINRDPDFNHQKVWYKPENVILENGILNIYTEEEHLSQMCCDIWDPNSQSMKTICADYDYTGGEIWTNYQFDEGFFEAKVKIPAGKGFFPAFWLFSHNGLYNEVDIFEFMDAHASKHGTNIICDNDYTEYREHCPERIFGENLSYDYHVFSLDWSKYRLVWSRDYITKRYHYQFLNINGQVTNCRLESYKPYFRSASYPSEPMYLILNLAIQNKENAPDHTTIFPNKLQVDWVRYYQRHPQENVYITSEEQFTIRDKVYNTLVGENIVVNTNFIIPDKQTLVMLASDEIYLKPGFHANKGCNLTIKTREDLFIHNKREENITEKLDEYYGEEELSSNVNENILINTSEITLYPNPCDDYFTVEVGDENVNDLLVIVTDLFGNILLQQQLTSNKEMIRVKDFSKGFYFVYIQSANSTNRKFFKLLKQ